MEGKTCMKIEREAVELASVVVGVSVLGSVVHWLRDPKKRRSVYAFLISISGAAFLGLQAHFLMQHLGYSYNLQFAISGALGYGSGTFLDAAIPFLMRLAYKKTGVEYSESDEAKEAKDAE